MEVEKIQFGGSPFEIDNLALKVLNGEKTATSSLLDYYLIGLKKKSQIGDVFSILNSFGKEITMVRIERIETIKFGDITVDFAIEEGDGTLENWKAIHHSYYSQLLSHIGKTLDEETLLVCEWFEVLNMNKKQQISDDMK